MQAAVFEQVIQNILLKQMYDYLMIIVSSKTLNDSTQIARGEKFSLCPEEERSHAQPALT